MTMSSKNLAQKVLKNILQQKRDYIKSWKNMTQNYWYLEEDNIHYECEFFLQ